ncbi:hypothetical protein WH52_03875 [Tenacibaculum holothuriorum]|uniref:Uncharacterized protein n=1 Tax=Tenacibaculum holothuriorum TaxID=1635173 RepID=A0A1Y2PEE4_9FLAO|nr:hypothetical protein [Tenacibaculum holothuriorum]OSY88815.1 hypothetical protein WH52_03875 [Tenacibaculum holothuriorum]
MKKILLVLILFNFAQANSQEKIGEFNHKSKTSNNDIIRSTSIFNYKNNNIATFILKGENIYGYLLNSNFQFIKKINIKNINPKYNILIGSFYDKNDSYNLILSNKIKNKFIFITFSFNSNNTVTRFHNLKNNNLVFLQSVSKSNICYLLFLNKKNSNIISKSYNSSGEKSTRVFDFHKTNFLINETKRVSLKKLITDFTKPNNNKIKNLEYELTKINETTQKNSVDEKPFFNNSIQKSYTPPHSIEITSRFSKLYVRDNTTIITLDKNRFYTQILKLNLDKGDYTFEKIKKPLFKEKSIRKRSNSFIHEDKIFLITATKKKLNCSIHNLHTLKKIKEIKANYNSPISFKNSLITQEGGAFKKHREFDNTSKFLRKVSESNIGIGVIKNNTEYEMIIGSEKLAEDGYNMVFDAISLGLGIYTNSLSYGSFSSYLTTKSVKFHSLFDENLNHKKGKIKKNIYDNIIVFIKLDKQQNIDDVYYSQIEDLNQPKGINIFKLNNNIVLGYYHPKTQKYLFHKF